MAKGYNFTLGSEFLKSNTRLLACQKEMLVWWHENKGLNYRQLSEMFRVSRTMAFFICNPDKLEKNRKTNTYKREKSNTEAVLKCRKNRETVIQKLKINEMKKVSITQNTGKTGIVDYVPEKPSYKQPVILDRFFDDEGEEILVLENGNTIPKIKYDAVWLPVKSEVKQKGYKGQSIVPPQRKTC